MPGYHWLPDRLKVRAQARRGRRDLRDLHRQLPGWAGTNPAAERIIPTIQARHADYVLATGTNVEMAASIELCRFLVRWCDLTRPDRIADLGSGISSWTLRTWRDSESTASEVVSVDDDEAWLNRSREYSVAAGTGDGGFVTWHRFLATPGIDSSFDLVLCDFGTVRDRASQMQQAFDLVAPGGAIICDDVQKARIWRAARDATRRSGFLGHSLREETLDSQGRFAWLARRPAETG